MDGSEHDSRTFRGTVMRDIDRHYRRLNEPRALTTRYDRAINRQVAYSNCPWNRGLTPSSSFYLSKIPR